MPYNTPSRFNWRFLFFCHRLTLQGNYIFPLYRTGGAHIILVMSYLMVVVSICGASQWNLIIKKHGNGSSDRIPKKSRSWKLSGASSAILKAWLSYAELG